jgi:hypothetical protein
MTTLAHRTSRWTPLGVAAMILGFLVWWPLGFAVLAYILWGGSIDQLLKDTVDQFKSKASYGGGSGNAAFDEYRKQTLKRLEEEQAEFADYVERLRKARDQEEFDRFMSERRRTRVTSALRVVGYGLRA